MSIFYPYETGVVYPEFSNSRAEAHSFPVSYLFMSIFVTSFSNIKKCDLHYPLHIHLLSPGM